MTEKDRRRRQELAILRARIEALEKDGAPLDPAELELDENGLTKEEQRIVELIAKAIADQIINGNLPFENEKKAPSQNWLEAMASLERG